MQSLLLTFVTVVLVVVGGLAGADDAACTARAFHDSTCCTAIDLVAKYNPENIKKCMQIHYDPNVDHASPERARARACLAECVMSEEGLLTADKRLDKDTISAFLGLSGAPSTASLTPLVEKCLNADVDSSQDCKSGTYEFHGCFFRELLLNCPASHWLASSECEELKLNVTKCPEVPVVVGMLRN